MTHSRFIVTFSLIGAFFVATHFLPLPKNSIILVTDLAWTFAVSFTTWKCWQLSNTLHGNIKLVWRFFAYAHFSWFIGILFWDYSELVSKVITPFPAISDLFFILLSVLFIVALVKMRTRENRSVTLIQISKLGILVSSIVIVLFLAFSDLLAHTSESNLYIFTTLIYPVLYVSAFLYSLLFFLEPQPTNQRPVLLFIVISAGLHAFSTIVYAYSLLGQNYAAGNYIDIVWLLAFAFMYFATTQQQPELNPEQKQLIHINKNIQRLLDAAMTPISILILLVMGVVFSSNLNENNINVLLFFTVILLIFFIVKEIATEKEQQQLKRDIKISEKRFHVISNTVPGIVYQFKMNDKGEQSFPYVSPRINTLLGLDPDEVMKNASLWVNTIAEEDLPNFVLTVTESFTTLEPWQWKGRMINTNGSVGWFRGESIPVKLKDHVLWTGIVIDITEEENAKQNLQYAHDQLEQRVKDRTEKFVAAKLQADLANNAKSEFLSNMSHELRTPLNAVLGFAQLLNLDDLPAQQKDSVTEILNAGEHLLRLVKDILELNNIEMGVLEFNPEAVELNKIINESINLVKNQTAEKNISINNEINPKAKLRLYTDSFRCKEVIVNLLSNAIKYNNVNGNVTIHESKDDYNITIYITDTGNGINDKYKSKVFEPFERLDKIGSGIDGTGIGLALSKKIIEMMGGTIGFETTVGKGSTFWISLPASKTSD